MGFCNSLGQILRDFSGWTSAHGVPHIGSAQNAILRVFWTVVFVACVGMFAFQMTTLVQKFLDYDVTVQTELKFEERKFPAVTSCPLNPWKNDLIQDTTLQNLTDRYNDALRNPQVSPDLLKEWGFQGVKEEKIQQRALKWTTWLGSTLPLEGAAITHLDKWNYSTYTYGESLAYEYEDFILNCAYNTKGCNVSDFNKVYVPTFGFCYTFNFEAKYSSTRAGPLYGLRLLLKADQARYMAMSPEAGAIVMIHDHGEAPHVDAYGFRASCGDATSIGARYVQTKRQPAPYGTCIPMTSSENLIHHYNGTYTVEGCFRSCFQNKVKEECSCYDPAYARPDKTTPSCADGTIDETNKKLDCVFNLLNAVNATSGAASFNVIAGCNCPQPCEESTYSVTVSTALWPSDVYKPADCTSKNSKFASEAACIDWYRYNTLLVEVFYERMNYQVMQESPAYTIVNLVSDMGGQLGLWMGISIITAVEFVALLLLLCMFCITRAKLADEDDDDEDEEKQANDQAKSQTTLNEDLYDDAADGAAMEPPPVKY